MAIDSTTLARYDSNFVTFGNLVSESLVSGSVGYDQKLNNTYYDFAYACYQARDRQNNNTFLTWANRGIQFYRDQYLAPNGYNVPGFWAFTHGLAEDWLRNGTTLSRNAINSLASLSNYHRNSPSELLEMQSDLYSRDNAYSGITYINQVRCGGTPNAFLTTRKTNALNHITAWTTGTATFFRPFMGALTAWFLIDYYTYIEADPAIVTALAAMADYADLTCWVPSVNSWTYTDRSGFSTDPADRSPQIDLNLLICPYYGWLWWQTGAEKYRTRGDAAFTAGVSQYSGGFWVSGAWLGGQTVGSVSGKQLCQNYFWSSQYLDWRSREFVSGPPDATTGTYVLNPAWTLNADTGPNMASDSLVMCLMRDTWTPTGNEQLLPEVLSHECSGNGYARATLSGGGISRLVGVTKVTRNPATFTASGGDIPAKWWLVFNNSSTSPAQPIVAYGRLWDSGDVVTIPSGRTLTVSFADGVTARRVVS